LCERREESERKEREYLDKVLLGKQTEAKVSVECVTPDLLRERALHPSHIPARRKDNRKRPCE
jgi:hypothetical protein